MYRFKRSSSSSDERRTAIQVITPLKDHSFALNELALEKILHDSRVKNSKVIVISVAGAFRMGKSFLLNFFLRYLYSRGSTNWIGDQNEPLTGFSWRRGTDRETSGILMWSEPFEVELSSGEKACVLLMDTQGAFDNKSTVKDCATVFALSMMLSSVQVYNIKCNLQNNDLQNLQLFTEYGRLASKDSVDRWKSFQDLHVLIRDWQNPDEYEYGWEGGKKYLAKQLEVKVGQHQDLRDPRQHIRSCFNKIGCFPMPHPGKKVTTDRNFNGRLSDIDDDFKLHLQEFVSSLLSTDSLVVKEINGKSITGKGLFQYFMAYTKIFQGTKLPEPLSIFQANEEANNAADVGEAMDYYAEHMELEVRGSSTLYVDPETLEEEHDRFLQKAVRLFQSKCKMGSEDKCRALEKNLVKQLETSYDNLCQRNNTIRATALAKATDRYKKLMEEEIKVSRGNDPYLDPVILEQKHDKCLQMAFQPCQSICKMSDQKTECDLKETLKRLVLDCYGIHTALNSSARSRTIAKRVLICTSVVSGAALVGTGIGAVVLGIAATTGTTAAAAAGTAAAVETAVVGAATLGTAAAVETVAATGTAAVTGCIVGACVSGTVSVSTGVGAVVVGQTGSREMPQQEKEHAA